MVKRIKQIKKDIDKISDDLLEKYPELDSINMDCCYGQDGNENSLNVSVFKTQEDEKK